MARGTGRIPGMSGVAGRIYSPLKRRAGANSRTSINSDSLKVDTISIAK
jgi:hypothetical protein